MTIILNISLIYTVSDLDFNCATQFSPLDQSLYERAHHTSLCVHFLPYKIKAQFRIVVDQNVIISVWNSFDALLTEDVDMIIQPENQ